MIQKLSLLQRITQTMTQVTEPKTMSAPVWEGRHNQLGYAHQCVYSLHLNSSLKVSANPISFL